MVERDDWIDLARKLDWTYSFVSEGDVFPQIMSGRPWLPHSEWQNWDEPYKTAYSEYVIGQSDKDDSVAAVRESIGRIEDIKKLNTDWVNALKLHVATLPLAEYAAVIGNLRAGRFGRDSAWRTMSTLGAMDELRHTQIPLSIMHELVRWSPQFDWAHYFYHSNNWVAIAARHLADELLVGADPVEFAVGTNFVFETGFTNLQFVGLSALAHSVGDRMFEKMVTSIQSDEARHSQIGQPVLATILKHDRKYAQYLLDKWFWRSWRLFAIVTGFSMDYFTPLENRQQSFKEFMEEWIIDQFLRSLDEMGLEKPWYWKHFIDSLDIYHHQVYASAYTYRATVWFNFVVPGPQERAWLKTKYPKHWGEMDPVWDQITKRWRESDPSNDFAVHGTAIVGFCDLCQVVLCGGHPSLNEANVLKHGDKKYIFCSKPCQWLFEQEPDRYDSHRDVVKRVLAGEAPGNVVALIRKYFGLNFDSWGKDAHQGEYPWLKR